MICLIEDYPDKKIVKARPCCLVLCYQQAMEKLELNPELCLSQRIMQNLDYVLKNLQLKSGKSGKSDKSRFRLFYLTIKYIRPNL
jgi:hypothetical protein